jgi:hypothetical protein
MQQWQWLDVMQQWQWLDVMQQWQWLDVMQQWQWLESGHPKGHVIWIKPILPRVRSDASSLPSTCWQNKTQKIKQYEQHCLCDEG